MITIDRKPSTAESRKPQAAVLAAEPGAHGNSQLLPELATIRQPWRGMVEARHEAERSLLLSEMEDMEFHRAALESQLSLATTTKLPTSHTRADDVVSKGVMRAELADLERKMEEARALQRAAEHIYHTHLSVFSHTLSSMEESEASLGLERAAAAQPPESSSATLAAPPVNMGELRQAVVALEHLLDAELGAPSPAPPLAPAPDLVCAMQLDQVLRAALASAPVHAQSRSALLGVEGRSIMSRAVQALGRRAHGITVAVQELAALQAILEAEIGMLEPVAAQLYGGAPAFAAPVAGG